MSESNKRFIFKRPGLKLITENCYFIFFKILQNRNKGTTVFAVGTWPPHGVNKSCEITLSPSALFQNIHDTTTSLTECFIK